MKSGQKNIFWSFYINLNQFIKSMLFKHLEKNNISTFSQSFLSQSTPKIKKPQPFGLGIFGWGGRICSTSLSRLVCRTGANRSNPTLFHNLCFRKAPHKIKCLNHFGFGILAGVVGFEPTVVESESTALTTWPHPNI